MSIQQNLEQDQELVVQSESSPTTQQEPAIPAVALCLVNRKLPIRFCEFKISNTPRKMLKSDTQAIAVEGIQFTSSAQFEPGVIMRVWIELPDYWSRKSRHVGYRHTEAPSWFQMLARVLSCDELNKRGSKFQILCESVNLDPADVRVLREFLGTGD